MPTIIACRIVASSKQGPNFVRSVVRTVTSWKPVRVTLKSQQFDISINNDYTEENKFSLNTSTYTTNELVVGRVALAGFTASLVGELLTGKGALAQLGYTCGSEIPLTDFDGFVLFLIAFNLVAGVAPFAKKYPTDYPADDLESSPTRPTLLFQIRSTAQTLWSNPQTLWSNLWSLRSKSAVIALKSMHAAAEHREQLLCRMAHLGFAASLLGEALTGRGVFQQLGINTGLRMTSSETLLILSTVFTVVASLAPATALLGTRKAPQELGDE